MGTDHISVTAVGGVITSIVSGAVNLGPVYTSNNVEATFDFVEATFDTVERIVQLVAFDNVASTLLLVWTGLYVDGQCVCDKLVTVVGHSLSHWPSTSVYNTVSVRPRVPGVCQRQRRLASSVFTHADHSR